VDESFLDFQTKMHSVYPQMTQIAQMKEGYPEPETKKLETRN